MRLSIENADNKTIRLLEKKLKVNFLCEGSIIEANQIDLLLAGIHVTTKVFPNNRRKTDLEWNTNVAQLAAEFPDLVIGKE